MSRSPLFSVPAFRSFRLVLSVIRCSLWYTNAVDILVLSFYRILYVYTTPRHSEHHDKNLPVECALWHTPNVQSAWCSTPTQRNNNQGNYTLYSINKGFPSKKDIFCSQVILTATNLKCGAPPCQNPVLTTCLISFYN